jgi:LPS-assembly protein
MAPLAHRLISIEPASGRPSLGLVKSAVSRFAVLLAAFGLFVALPSHAALAQATLADKISASNKDKKAPMMVEAKTVVYNDNTHTVSAEGDAQIYYQGKVLEADRVTYNRDTGRVFAEGSVKLTEPDGGVTHADKMDLTGDFKEGFVDSVRADSKERTHFSAPRSEKIDADTTVFEKGTYTACPSCADHPDRPPLWRVRAKKIIHKNEERMIYYEDAWFELYGVPIAYIPFMSAADPSVTRQSGFLAPHLMFRSTTGFGFGTPYFWAIAPNMDVTLTPNYLTKQGALGDIEFRHRLDNGYYTIQAIGIHQNNTDAFGAAPYGSQGLINRGAILTQGTIFLNQSWKVGWDIARISDKWFMGDYGIPNPILSGNLFRENSSTIYLTGQGERGYFDLRGYTFQATSNSDYQPQLANVAPLLEYNKTFDVAPDKSMGIGGQIEVDANITNSWADAASYQQIGSVSLDRAYGLYPVCRNAAGQRDYYQGSCLLRGVGGQYSNASVNVSWKRKYIDPLGEVWTPFAFARAQGDYLAYNTSRTYTWAANGVSDTIANVSQNNFLSGNNSVNGSITPGAGVEWRYPLLAQTGIGSLVIEPIAQVIARPNGQNTNTMVNLDSQSLVFDDSSLFEWSKYSGYDRFETGVRANYGAQFTLDMNKNGYINAVFGQSRELAGVNSYATPDAANIGLSSGLDTPASDYVSRFTWSPSSAYTFVTKMRFDQGNWAVRRLDIAANANFGFFTLGAQFANYEQQPEIGYNVRREGLQFNTRYDVTPNYYTTGSINFDLGRHYYNAFLADPAPIFYIAGYGLGLGYKDDCTKVSLNYTDVVSDNYGNPATYARNRTLLLSVELRTLGDFKAPISLGTAAVQDGVKYN